MVFSGVDLLHEPEAGFFKKSAGIGLGHHVVFMGTNVAKRVAPVYEKEFSAGTQYPLHFGDKAVFVFNLKQHV